VNVSRNCRGAGAFSKEFGYRKVAEAYGSNSQGLLDVRFCGTDIEVFW